MAEIKSPVCPLCRKPPAMAFGETWFCGNEECKTLAWNPYLGDEQLLDASFVDIREKKEEQE